MRGGPFKLGRAFGIDVKVHWTFLLLLLFFAGYGYAGLRALPAVEGGMLFGMLAIEDVGHASLLRQPTRR